MLNEFLTESKKGPVKIDKKWRIMAGLKGLTRGIQVQNEKEIVWASEWEIMNDMQEILRALLGGLGPEVTEFISSKFDVPEDAAAKVLPSVAPLVAFRLQEKAPKQANDKDALGEFLVASRNNKLELESFFKDGGVSEAVLTDIFGSSLIRIINNLANNLQIGYIQTQSILASVTAIVLVYIARRR